MTGTQQAIVWVVGIIATGITISSVVGHIASVFKKDTPATTRTVNVTAAPRGRNAQEGMSEP